MLTAKWLDDQKGTKSSKIQIFLEATIEKIERKKQCQVLKIIEDWLKNYQNINQADNNDEKVIKDQAEPLYLIQLKQITPYDNANFCKFLFRVIEEFLLN